MQALKGLHQRLLDWYQTHHRQLPWRDTTDPYRIWVSEVMLQQTQVVKVLEYYSRFLKAFPTVEALARADLQDVLKQWEGMGYYSRARNLHRAAGLIVDEYDGHIPVHYDDFHALPGVGDYIAAAVLSIAFRQPYAVVDGNVKRVLARLFCLKEPVNDTRAKRMYQEKAEQLLDRHHPDVYNQAIMELGALICRPQTPQCDACPIQPSCEAFRSGTQQDFPVRKKRKPVPEYNIAVGVVQKGEQLLITRRKTDGLLGGLWEFPGGKIKTDEAAAAACQREILEEVNLQVRVDEKVTEVRHAYTHFKIKLDVFLCQYISGEVELNGPIDFRWIHLHEVDDFPFPKANHKFIPLLKQKLD